MSERYHSLVMAGGLEHPESGPPARPGNPFGILEALFGLAAGFVFGSLALAAYDGLTHSGSTPSTGRTIVSVAGLWVGFLGAVLLASRLAHGRAGGGLEPEPLLPRLAEDYGLSLKPWPDIPLGILLGVASQYVLVPLLDLLLQPFVPDLYSRLGRPTHQLLGPAQAGTASLVAIGLVVCLGSPIVEELFFRGLFLRGLLYRTARLRGALGPVVSVVVTGLFFALVHFEPLQFLGLAGFGVVLSILAWRTGRLGPGIVAHMAFNTTTVLVYVFVR